MPNQFLIFSITFHPFVGGAEVALKEVVERLPQYQFTLLTARLKPELPTEEQHGNLRIIRLGQGSKLDKYLYPFRAVRRAVELERQVKFAAVWAMMANYAGLAALLFKWRSKLPYLLTLQSGDSEAFIWSRTWFWRPLYRQIFKSAFYIQAISSHLERRARRLGYSGELTIIPNGVNLDFFKNDFTADQVENMRQQLRLSKADLVLITASRLAIKNGLTDLIKAINILNFKMGIPAKLLILGSGPEENRLKDLADNQGVGDRVAFLGFVEQKELSKYFAVSDIFCRPSLSEGLGNSFLEAMAFGLPVIGTPVGGIVDFLKDGETGIFCKPGKAYSIAQAVERYDKDRDLYLRVSKNGRQLVESKYQWPVIARAIGQLLEKVSNERS